MKPKFLTSIGRVGAASIVGGATAVAGLAAWGGVQLASAGAPAANFGCSNTSAAVTFSDTNTGPFLWLNSNAGNAKAAVIPTEAPANGSDSFGTTSPAVPGETVVINKVDYTVASFNPSNGTLTLTSDVEGLKKAPTSVDIEPTTTGAETTAYDTANTTTYNTTSSGCSTAAGTTAFAPTAGITGVGTQASTGNGAAGIENGQKDLGFTLSFPSDADYSGSSNTAVLEFKTATFNGTGYNLNDGSLSGNKALAPSEPLMNLTEKNISGAVNIDGAVVCTVDQIEAIDGGANPATTCDGDNAAVPTHAAAAGELASVQANGSGNGSDGSPLLAIYEIDVAGSFTGPGGAN